MWNFNFQNNPLIILKLKERMYGVIFSDVKMTTRHLNSRERGEKVCDIIFVQNF